ncbi:MAG TPA: Ig-like domain-containing protein, partial [Aquihabitans sp.]|nr:Ig-like domain-containing protein [Aquihabitans sp.]
FNNNNNPTPKTVHANHLTVVGGGASSRGVWAWAKSSGAQQTAVVNLENSIVRTSGGTDLMAEAGNSLPAGQTSNGVINVSWSDFATKTSSLTNNGVGGVVEVAGNVNTDPVFVDPASGNYRLLGGSPLVDAGSPSPGGPATDRAGAARVFDGNGDGTARRDVGAYEFSDTTPPDTTISSGPNGVVADNTPTFGFASEPGATFECSVDSAAFGPCSGPGATHTTGVLTDGPHSFAVQATDQSGNTDPSPATRSFTVDATAPDTTLVGGPSGTTTDSTPTFTFSSEAGATFECQVDGGAYAPCTSPFTPATLADGAHTFSVRAKDAVGNTDGTPATRAFTVDTVAPETTVTKKPAKRTFKKKAKIAFSSSEAGATFQCQVDAKAWKACTSPFKVRLGLGKHVILVRATDAAGNVDATPARVKVRRVAKS